MKRLIKVVKNDGSEDILELAQAVQINVHTPILQLEQMRNGKWKILWSSTFCEDMTAIKSLEIIREG